MNFRPIATGVLVTKIMIFIYFEGIGLTMPQNWPFLKNQKSKNRCDPLVVLRACPLETYILKSNHLDYFLIHVRETPYTTTSSVKIIWL